MGGQPGPTVVCSPALQTRRLSFFFAALLIGLGAGQARAQEPTDPEESSPELKAAKAHYQDLDFEKCLKKLAQASKARHSRADEIEIELYSGLCAFNLGDKGAAERHFRAALELEPTTELPAYTSPKIVELFRGIQRRVERAKPPLPEPAPERTVEAPARTEPLVEPEPEQPAPETLAVERRRFAPEAPAASRPAPVLPIVLAGLAVAAAGTGTYFGLQARDQAERANGAFFESDAIAHGERAQRNALIANVSFGVAAIGGVSAALTFAFE